MKILSEKTGLEYKTVAECEAAEAEYDVRLKEEKERKEALSMERSARSKEIEAAYARIGEIRKEYNEALSQASKEYTELLSVFCKDYGSYHVSYTGRDVDRFNPFSLFTSIWF